MQCFKFAHFSFDSKIAQNLKFCQEFAVFSAKSDGRGARGRRAGADGAEKLPELTELVAYSLIKHFDDCCNTFIWIWQELVELSIHVDNGWCRFYW